MSICPDGIYAPRDKAPHLRALRVIVTRYNIHNTEDPRWTSLRATEGWLERRLKIFNAFCLPSVVQQVQHPDLWLLGFDGEMRDAVKPVIEIIRQYPWIIPVWHEKRAGGEYETLRHRFHAEIERHLQCGLTHVISIRLDNDDALNLKYIQYLSDYSAAVVQRFPALEDFWLTFPFGVSYHAQKCSMHVYSNSPFLSHVQTASHFLSNKNSKAFGGGHANVFARGRVFLPITTQPMWIQNVHGDNILNRPPRTGMLRLASQEVLSHCGIKVEGNRPSHLISGARRLLRSLGLRKT